MSASFSDSVHGAARPVSGNRNTRRVGNRAAMDEINAAFGASRITDDLATNLADYNGRNIHVRDAVVLKHIVDGFADHLGRTDEPNFRFEMDTFHDLGDSSYYKAKDDGPGSKFNAKVMCKYDINNDINDHNLTSEYFAFDDCDSVDSEYDQRVASEYFAIDNIYFEALGVTTKKGVPAKNHGTSWMNIYLGKRGFDQFVRKFVGESGWQIKDSLFTTDNEQGLASLPVSFDEEDPPVWTNLVLPDGKLEEWGTVPEVIRAPDRQGIYLGTGIFTMSFSVVARGATVKTLVCERDERMYDWGSPLRGRISLRLVGTRVIRREPAVLPLFLGRKKHSVKI